jgi:predicted dehydrogenase
MPETKKIGFIGLDTSHVTAFARLLHNADEEFHLPGWRVAAAYPGGSDDFELSKTRVEGFTTELRDRYGVPIVESPEEVAERCDAVFIESVDGRVHLEQFQRIASFGKPVFIDKPFALSSREAREMADLAKRHRLPMMSSSALRYAEGLLLELQDESKGAVIGADCYGPMPLQPTQPGLFWYGIHAVEMLYAIMGRGCERVTASVSGDHDLVVGVWRDGRIGTVRGNRKGNQTFGALIHREKGSQLADIYAHRKPYYAGLLEHVIRMIETGKPPIDPEETVEIVRFIEAANESRETGKTLEL